MTTPPFVVRPVNYQAYREKLHAIRKTVFIEEQHVPEDLEWDDVDPVCYHVLALALDGTPIGTGRLLPDGHIGRMAVLKQWRGKGVGRAMLELLLHLAWKEGHTTVRLHAQTQALGFYAQYGFKAVGKEFMEAGIAHFRMKLKLDVQPALPQVPKV